MRGRRSARMRLCRRIGEKILCGKPDAEGGAAWEKHKRKTKIEMGGMCQQGHQSGSSY